MEALSKTEREIIREMIVKEYGQGSLFLDQLAGARVENREFTGRGVFVNLRLAENIPPIDQLNSEISRGYKTALPAPADVVGFTLFIRNGRLSFLEGYTFGDWAEWPGELSEDWLVMRPIVPAKQKAR